LRDDGEAEDVMHDVFERAIVYKHSLAKAESGLLWLYRVAERCCFDRLKKRRRQTPVAPEVISQVAHGALSQSAVEAREVIAALLGRFEPKVQQVALLYYIDGLRQEEIAQQLGWSRRTVIKKLALLRRQALALVQASASTAAGGAR
jgi:RNA polymerase sigma-70 factor (ECF subfamily)